MGTDLQYGAASWSPQLSKHSLTESGKSKAALKPWGEGAVSQGPKAAAT